MNGAVGMKCEEGEDRGEAGGEEGVDEVGRKLGKGGRWRRKTGRRGQVMGMKK